MFARLFGWIERLFNQHMLIRRTIVVWAMWLITIVVLRATAVITEINAAVVSLVGTIVGILTTVTVFYVRMRELDRDD